MFRPEAIEYKLDRRWTTPAFLESNSSHTSKPETLRSWIERGLVPGVGRGEPSPGRRGRLLPQEEAEIVATFAVIAETFNPRWARDVVEKQISHGRKLPNRFTVHRDEGSIIYGAVNLTSEVLSSTTFHVDRIRERLAEEVGPRA